MRTGILLAAMASLGLTGSALATTTDGACPVESNEPIAAIAASARDARHVSDRQFRKDVAELLHTTDGVWGPSVGKVMKEVTSRSLSACGRKKYKALLEAYGKSEITLWKAEVDGRSIFMFETDEDGATGYDLRDASCHALKMGDRPHEKIPLPHSEEPDHPISKTQWMKDLKDAMRYPVQAHDTPIVTGDDIPAAIKDVAKKIRKNSDVQSVEVHHVRVDGHDSWLIYTEYEDGEGQQMFDVEGHELDVMI